MVDGLPGIITQVVQSPHSDRVHRHADTAAEEQGAGHEEQCRGRDRFDGSVLTGNARGLTLPWHLWPVNTLTKGHDMV